MTTEPTLNAPNNDATCTTDSEKNRRLGIPIVRSESLENRREETRKSLPYQIAYFKETFSDELWQAMEHRDLNQSAFALKADVPKQFLTKVFRGGNCTMETMVKLAFALNYKVNVHLTPNEIGCAWIHHITDFAIRQPNRFSCLLTDVGYQHVNNVVGELNYDFGSATA